MYNSHIVGVLVNIWTGILNLYEDSLVNKIFNGVKSFIIYITRESKLIGMFRDKSLAIENSFINRSYRWILKKYNKIVGKINRKITRIQEDSLVDGTIDELVGDYDRLFQTILVFSMFFSLGILGQGLIYGSSSIKLNLLSISIIVLSVIVLNTGNNIVDIFKNSLLVNILLNLISSKEEGSGQWW